MGPRPLPCRVPALCSPQGTRWGHAARGRRSPGTLLSKGRGFPPGWLVALRSLPPPSQLPPLQVERTLLATAHPQVVDLAPATTSLPLPPPAMF